MAEWRAVVARLDGFEMSVASAEHLETAAESIHVAPAEGGEAIDLEKLLVQLPNGMPQVAADGSAIRPHERMLVTGPSGAGKSTLFRAIAGIWPFGSGAISIPANASLMMLPQKPYFPIGTLHAAIAYPGEAGAFSAERMQRGAGRGRPAATRRRGWTRRNTGTGCCRSASSSGSASHGRCCRPRNSCSWTRRPPRSTSRRRPRSIACSRTSCPTPPSSRSATARRWRRFIRARSRWRATAIISRLRAAGRQGLAKG